MATQALTDNSLLLRRALRGNAIFSGLSGTFVLVASGPVAAFLGLENRPIFGMSAATFMAILGFGTLLYAVALAVSAAQTTVNRALAMGTVVMDSAWVAASVIVLLTGAPPLTTAGSWAVLIVADIVLVFAIAQYVGLRRASQADVRM